MIRSFLTPICVVGLLACGGVTTSGERGDGQGESSTGGASPASDGGQPGAGGSSAGGGTALPPPPDAASPPDAAPPPDAASPPDAAAAVPDSSPAPADAGSCEGHESGEPFKHEHCGCLPPGCSVCVAPAFCGPVPGTPPFSSPFEECTTLVAAPGGLSYCSCFWTDADCPSCYCGL